jgi:hypothetical protein
MPMDWEYAEVSKLVDWNRGSDVQLVNPSKEKL